MHLIFVEKAEIVHFDTFALYKRKKVWYNKQWWVKTESVWLAFFVCFTTVPKFYPLEKCEKICKTLDLLQKICYNKNEPVIFLTKTNL